MNCCETRNEWLILDCVTYWNTNKQMTHNTHKNHPCSDRKRMLDEAKFNFWITFFFYCSLIIKCIIYERGVGIISSIYCFRVMIKKNAPSAAITLLQIIFVMTYPSVDRFEENTTIKIVDIFCTIQQIVLIIIIQYWNIVQTNVCMLIFANPPKV